MTNKINIGQLPDDIACEIKNKTSSGGRLTDDNFKHLREDITHLMYQKALTLRLSKDELDGLGVNVAEASALMVRTLRSTLMGQAEAVEIVKGVHKKINEAFKSISAKSIS